MALNGKIIKLANRKYGFEIVDCFREEPVQLRQVWEIAAYRTSGYSYCRAEEAVGKAATITDGRVQCYLGNGNHLLGELAQLGSTPSIIMEQTPVPKPKVKAGIEVRWHNYRWEKQLRTGWKAA